MNRQRRSGDAVVKQNNAGPKQNNGRAGRADYLATVGAEIAALEARAERLMKDAAVLQFEAMRCIAQARDLYRVRNGGSQ